VAPSPYQPILAPQYHQKAKASLLTLPLPVTFDRTSYSGGGACPSALSQYKAVCAASQYPRLDYYIRQPVVWDYYVGVYKAYRVLAWNAMSLHYEPVKRFVPADPPGHVRREDRRRTAVAVMTVVTLMMTMVMT
jgi:hypothetical protein